MTSLPIQTDPTKLEEFITPQLRKNISSIRDVINATNFDMFTISICQHSNCETNLLDDEIYLVVHPNFMTITNVFNRIDKKYLESINIDDLRKLILRYAIDLKSIIDFSSTAGLVSLFDFYKKCSNNSVL